ncbi:DUF4179 domain-containing protein [Bacillus alkalicellulosilyticus]|uniref:DUF4179 domain-containing protein n=1 Tax=Alkalihalobacterium alkalicellulosilyticum TaxID=1912214 RepID=UPI00099665F1|nr:DUF4179 domain-containing protein [Bacillus alkalicellulosilyticus]
MNNIEKRLAEEKIRLDTVTAPDELEMRLRDALDETPTRSKRKSTIWKLATVALIFLFIGSYHYNAFAFYGKKLFGFDEIMTNTLQQLNEQGMGQTVDKRTILEDGTEFVVDGIMTDANQLILYFTLSNPDGITYSAMDTFTLDRVSGFLTNSPIRGGQYQVDEENNELKGTMSFDPVSPFAKKLTIHFDQLGANQERIQGEMTFPYNPNQAMQTQIKQTIREKLEVDKGTITFHSITATPSLTVIDGRINVDNYDRVPYALEGVKLLANGTPVEWRGGSSSSSIRGLNFEIHFDALPEKLDSLELVMSEFVGYEELDERISLIDVTDEPHVIGGKELWIQHIEVTSERVEITIATDYDVMLDGVSIQSGNEITPLRTIERQSEIVGEDGQYLKQRTLLFDTTEQPEAFLIQGMHYMKPYDKRIVIPVK